MIEYISQYPIAGVALVLLAVLTIFVFFMALTSGKKRSAERERIIADIEREKALRKEFKNVDEAMFSELEDNYRLVVGMCAHIQQSIETAEDMVKAFNNLSEVKQFVYALGYVFEDSKNSLSDFFRANGEPLLSTANKAVSHVIGGRFAEVFSQAYSMFDENDETVSVDDKRIDSFDNEFKSIIAEKGDEIYSFAADYIRQNKNEFIWIS